MRSGQRLSDQGYHQRVEEIAKAFSGRYGEVEYGSARSRSGESAKLQIVVIVPGWGLPRTATLIFIEKHARRAGAWHRYAYAYDLHVEPRRGGRFAYHWHDGVPHRHCVDPARPRPGHHYEAAYFDDIGWAAAELFRVAATGIGCDGLRPLEDVLPEPTEP